MLKNINYNKILFFDIETVPLTYDFKDLEERAQGLWDRKTRFLQQRDNLSPDAVSYTHLTLPTTTSV